ncbi:hypothetical protein V1520DRAFT_357874 [Lipomyces starkeyi]|uniref:Uncharacterized protein n=1 Tax=Lipomyces starkeyi NRRL Y-11557 TaxID=675824 RepID=A0A1E3QE63_LIPST|nr:hypothetical protein LIPSTDRAFT_1399 [Lipomyces starkeyi NRRL Y-11557]
MPPPGLALTAIDKTSTLNIASNRVQGIEWHLTRPTSTIKADAVPSGLVLMFPIENIAILRRDLSPISNPNQSTLYGSDKDRDSEDEIK